MKNSIENFKQLLNNYDQQIIQPIIDEILANFEHDLNKFQASFENWGKLANLEIKLSANYRNLLEVIKNGYIKSKLHKDKINSFFIRNDEKDISKSDHITLLYEYKKILSNIQSKSLLLLQFEENKSAYKPIHFIFAFIHDQKKLEQLIDKYNLDVNDKSKHDSVAIHFAAESGNIQGVELLLNHFQADINAKTNANQTAIHYIAVEGHFKSLAKILLYPNLELNIQNIYGNTPFHLAIFNGWAEIVESLLENRADFTISNNNGNNALFMAARSGYTDIFKMLVPYFKQQELFDIDKINSNGSTLLQMAIYGCSKRLVKCLIKDYKADVNLAPNDEYPLAIAINEGHEPIAKCLLYYGAQSLEYLRLEYTYFDNLSHSPIAYILSVFDNFLGSIGKISQTGGILVNKFFVIDVIKNWHKFKPSLRENKDSIADIEQTINNGEDTNIITFNELKIKYLSVVINDISRFFYVRQKMLISVDIHDSNFMKLVIDWNKFNTNLFHKAVINEIMSGDIRLYDAKTSSQEIIKILSEHVAIFLFNKSKFLNEKLEYQGIIKSEERLTYNILNGDSTPDLHLMNADNYQAIERWKNEYFFKIIGVVKKNIKLNDAKENEHEISEAKEQKELAKTIWESDEILSLIASHLSVESYFNSLKNKSEISNYNDLTKQDSTLVGEDNNEVGLI